MAILPFLALAAGLARAETIVYHLRGLDGKPIKGQPITLYMAEYNLVIDNCQTDENGLCTLRDEAYVGHERCLVAIKPGWLFAGKAPDGGVLPNPLCAVAHPKDYYFLGAETAYTISGAWRRSGS